MCCVLEHVSQSTFLHNKSVLMSKLTQNTLLHLTFKILTFYRPIQRFFKNDNIYYLRDNKFSVLLAHASCPMLLFHAHCISQPYDPPTHIQERSTCFKRDLTGICVYTTNEAKLKTKILAYTIYFLVVYTFYTDD